MCVQHELYMESVAMLARAAEERLFRAESAASANTVLGTILRPEKFFDHRVLQDVHDLIAAQFRFIERDLLVQKVREMGPDEGFNALTETYENLVKAGVIDPVKVVRSALQNASSIASLLLTTEALISEIPEEKKDAPAMPGGGGMGGMY